MRKFILESLLFLSILIGLIALQLDYYEHNKKYDIDHSYMASIIDKHKRLEQFNNNRLLLVGGSNLAFSINSELIERELDKNVVNLGLQIGLGLEFIINEVMASIREGDIVLLSLEYELYDDYWNPDLDLIDYTQKIYPESKMFYIMTLKEKLSLYEERFRKSFQKAKYNVIDNSIYNRNSFNKFGDAIGHLNQPRLNHLNFEGNIKINSTKRSILLLRELNLKCRKVGAKLYISFPTYASSSYCKNKNVIIDLSKRLRLDLKDIDIINEPEHFVFNDSLFYDTAYHLNQIGREKRTKMLIDILKSRGF